MEVSTERENGTLVARVDGRIDGATARDFEDVMQNAITDDDRAVVVSLEGLSYISSAGLRAILLIAKTLWKRDAAFALCSLDDTVTEVFKIAGFDKIIQIHPTQADAIAAVSG